MDHDQNNYWKRLFARTGYKETVLQAFEDKSIIPELLPTRRFRNAHKQGFVGKRKALTSVRTKYGTDVFI